MDDFDFNMIISKSVHAISKILFILELYKFLACLECISRNSVSFGHSDLHPSSVYRVLHRTKMRTNGQPERRVSFFSSFLSASFWLLYLWKEEFFDRFLNFGNEHNWTCSLRFVVGFLGVLSIPLKENNLISMTNVHSWRFFAKIASLIFFSISLLSILYLAYFCSFNFMAVTVWHYFFCCHLGIYFLPFPLVFSILSFFLFFLCWQIDCHILTRRYKKNYLTSHQKVALNITKQLYLHHFQ